MNRVDFKTKILALHDHPQQSARASLAVDTLYAGIDELQKMGQMVKVDFLDPITDTAVEWPKMLYHDAAAPLGRVFHREDQVPTEPGWRTEPRAMAESDSESKTDSLGQPKLITLQAPEGFGETLEVDGTSYPVHPDHMVYVPEGEKDNLLDQGFTEPEGKKDSASLAKPAGTIQRGSNLVDASYPKRLYHPMFPGGMEVKDADTEAAQKGQGWKDKPAEGTDGRGFHGELAHRPELAAKANNTTGKAADKKSPSANPLAHPEQSPEAPVEPVGGNKDAGQAELDARDEELGSGTD